MTKPRSNSPAVFLLAHRQISLAFLLIKKSESDFVVAAIVCIVHGPTACLQAHDSYIV